MMPKLFLTNSIFGQLIASHYNVPNPEPHWNIIVLMYKITGFNKQK